MFSAISESSLMVTSFTLREVSLFDPILADER